MRKGLATFTALAALTISAFGGSAQAMAPLTCPTSQPATAIAQGVTPGSVNPNGAVTYRLSVPSGTQGVLVLNAAGDADMIVCRAGTTSGACVATNPAVTPDFCADEGLEGWPGFGPGLAPGGYWLKIVHCMDASCGYQVNPPAPVAFTLTFAAV